MAELLRPTRKELQATYDNEFIRMAQVDVPLEELEAVRETMISELNKSH